MIDKIIIFAFQEYLWAGGHKVLEVLGWGRFGILNHITKKEEIKEFPWWYGLL